MRFRSRGRRTCYSPTGYLLPRRVLTQQIRFIGVLSDLLVYFFHQFVISARIKHIIGLLAVWGLLGVLGGLPIVSVARDTQRCRRLGIQGGGGRHRVSIGLAFVNR